MTRVDAIYILIGFGYDKDKVYDFINACDKNNIDYFDAIKALGSGEIKLAQSIKELGKG